jgi:hypothetical protein
VLGRGDDAGRAAADRAADVLGTMRGSGSSPSRRLHQGDATIVIPSLVPERSAVSVLTPQLVPARSCRSAGRRTSRAGASDASGSHD